MKLSKIELLAMTVHSSLKTYCSMLGFPYAIPRWENLSDADTDFAIKIVDQVLELLKTRELEPSDVHDLWVKERLAMGYQYGFKRDRATKVHPNMKPYSLLPKKEQLKAKIVLETIRLFGTIESQSSSFSGDVAHGF